MDYSAVAGEEHPEASPWASSPQHNKPAFEVPHASDIPPSPYAGLASPQQPEHDGPPFQSEPPSAASAPSENGESRHQQEQNQPPYNPQQQQQQQQQQSQSPPLQQHPRGQRYHGQAARRVRPQYKLQAKITGLERSGKKDIIVRFDVYVRPFYTNYHSIRLILSQDQPS
jgi:hypothetical protein